MRLPAVGLSLWLACAAQADWRAAMVEAVRIIRESGQVTQPEAPASPLPEPSEPRENELLVERAQALTQTGDKIRAEGSVRLRLRGYVLEADLIIGNIGTRVFRLEGNARVVGRDRDLRGAFVEVDLRNDTFRFLQGRATLGPEALMGRSQGDLFIRADHGGGPAERFIVERATLTTCDLEHRPHFHFDGKHTEVIPGRRAIIRDASTTILGRTVLRIPYLVVPLDEDADRNLPEFGHGPDEGYFVRTRWTTPLGGGNTWDTLVDYYTRLGAGLGGQFNYSQEGRVGVLSAYALTGGPRSFVMNARHAMNVGLGQLQFDSSYQQNNFMTAPESTLWNTRAVYHTPLAGGTLRMSFTQNSNERSGFRALSQSFGISDTRRFGPRLQTRLDLNYAKSTSSTDLGPGTRSERLDIRFNSRFDMRSVAADLQYSRSVPIGETRQFFRGSDRTPYLTLQTDTRRLFPGAARDMPDVRAEFGLGELFDPARRIPITKIAFDLSARSRGAVGDRGLTWGARFWQGMYSDGTAQFLIGADAQYRLPLFRGASIGTTYRHLRPQGFTPLAVDRASRFDAFTLDLNYQPNRSFMFSAHTGYDLLQSHRGQAPWQQVFLRSEFRPMERLRFRANASYDTFNEVWGFGRFDMDWSWGDTRLTMAAHYDARRSIWAGTSVALSGFRTGRTELSFLLDYNGYTRMIESQQLSLVYDLHCTEAVLEIVENRVGFRSGRQIGLFLRLKAFPFQTPWGTGTRGQSVGLSGFAN